MIKIGFKDDWPREAHFFQDYHLPPYEGTKADSWISSMCSGTSKKPCNYSGYAPVDLDISCTALVFSAE